MKNSWYNKNKTFSDKICSDNFPIILSIKNHNKDWGFFIYNSLTTYTISFIIFGAVNPLPYFSNPLLVAILVIIEAKGIP